MSPTEAADLHRLLVHSRWVKRLAASLVGDPHRAEDLVQDTWLAAMKERPRTDRPVRGWLATVLRNLVRQDARSSRRRSGREEDAARAEALPSTLDLVERLSRHREVVEAIEGLAEPHRQTLLLRYLEELAPTEIARRSDVPVATVKTRLARGLELLRARLDARDANGWRGWLLAWLPLIDRPGAVSATTLGTLLVSTTAKVALVLAAVAAGVYAAWSPEDSASPGLQNEAVAAAEPSALAPIDPVTRSGERTEAEPVPTGPPGPESAPADTPRAALGADASPAAPLRGYVFDAEGARAGRVALRHVASGSGAASGAGSTAGATTASNADGSFQFEGALGRGSVLDDEDRLVTVLSGIDSGHHVNARPVVVVAPIHPITGRVIDEAGRALAGVRVSTTQPAGFRSRFGEVMDYSADIPNRTETDADGRFELAETPYVDGSQLVATFTGLHDHVESIPEAAGADLVIVMRRAAVTVGALRGRVVDADGAGVPEASVAYGLERGRTDEYGFFEFDMDSADSINRMAESRGSFTPRRLIAMKSGYQPARIDVAPIEKGDEGGELAWPDSIELRLGDPPLTLGGTVVDERGEPLAGISVWVDDPTLFSMSRAGAVVLESELAGSTERWNTTETDAYGRFELNGLTDRTYRIACMDSATLARAETSAEAGRADARLVLDSGRRWKRVAGRVLDRSGAALAGVAVAPVTDSFRLRYQGDVVSTSHAGLDAVLTDEEGHFELFDVPEELVYLRLDGEDILSMDHGRHVEGGLGTLHAGELEDMRITAGVRMHLIVELEDPAEADELSILDDAGERLTINVIRGTSRSERPRVPLTEGRSDTLTVHDGARTLVLFRGGEEVRRTALELVRGDINQVRP